MCIMGRDRRECRWPVRPVIRESAVCVSGWCDEGQGEVLHGVTGLLRGVRISGVILG